MYNNVMEECFVSTNDKVKIALNHFKNGFEEVIIVVPGWFMTKDSKAFFNLSKAFLNYFDVITMDCRGHGKSSGYYTFSAKEIEDLKSVVNYARKFYKKVYLMGFSLGGGLVLIHTAKESNIDKVIAVSAYNSFEKIENKMWKKQAWLPTLKKAELTRWFSIRPSLIPHKKIKPFSIVDKIKVPTLFIAGKNDPTVCLWHTKSLYEKAVCDKYFEVFENGNHAEDLFLDEPNRFVSLCVNFLKSPFRNSYNQTSKEKLSLSRL